MGAGFASVEETAEHFEEIIETGSNIAREALARAIGFRPSEVFEAHLLKLSHVPNLAVQLEAIHSMGMMPSARFLPRLISMLEVRRLRPAARETLLKTGERALELLHEALEDETTTVAIRRHLPRTISRFDPSLAAEMLVERLPNEQDSVVRYKILRALGRLIANNPKLQLNQQVLRTNLNDTITLCFQLIDWHRNLARGAEVDPERNTDAHVLLCDLIRDMETNALERMFRVLGLLNPKEDFAIIYRGLKSDHRAVGSSSRELQESFLEPSLRRAVLGLIDDAPDSIRLRCAEPFHTPADLPYPELLGRLLRTPGDSVKSLAAYHSAELELTELRPVIERLKQKPTGFLGGVLQRSAERLAGGTPEPEAAS